MSTPSLKDVAGETNETPVDETVKDVGGVTGAQLKQYIERIERIEEEKKALAENIKEVYGEAKAMGFDSKAMRQIVKLRNMDNDTRRAEEEILAIYMAAIGLA